VVLCPICKEAPDLPQDPKVGDQLDCPECGSLLEIVSLAPITFEVVEEDEDEDDFDDDLDEEEDDEDDPDDEEDLIGGI
jgi:hypothetical protein